MIRFFSLLLISVLVASTAFARGVYQQPTDFISNVFTGAIPTPNRLWLTGTRKQIANDILGHPPTSLRLRYWGQGSRTAWILKEIGKEKPITVGIVINNNRIERIKVLIFLESRGWEVRHDFFTEQFNGLGIKNGQELDKHIDGISGATLSVRALKKLSRLALYLHTQTPFSHDTP